MSGRSPEAVTSCPLLGNSQPYILNIKRNCHKKIFAYKSHTKIYLRRSVEVYGCLSRTFFNSNPWYNLQYHILFGSLNIDLRDRTNSKIDNKTNLTVLEVTQTLSISKRKLLWRCWSGLERPRVLDRVKERAKFLRDVCCWTRFRNPSLNRLIGARKHCSIWC